MADLRVLFFLFMVQSVLMSLTGLRLFGINIKFRTVLLIGIIHGLAVWVVRGIYTTYEIPFGTHTIILMIVLVLLINILGKVKLGNALAVALVAVSLIMLGSALTDALVPLLKLDGKTILENTWLHILFGYMENVFLVLFLAINGLFGFTLSKIISFEN